jgi:hypothetical protein
MKTALKKRARKADDIATRRRVYCARNGHTKIITMCFGYVHCARCEAQIGDTLGSTFDTTDCVVVGHNCDKCRANFAMLTRTQKHLVPEKCFPKARSA